VRPKLLDLYSGAGGAAVGYHRAGFDVTGVDIRPMPRYPFAFHQADALEFLAEHGSEYDVIHASPPCQGYSVTSSMPWVPEYPKLIEPVRAALKRTGRPYVIENVPGAPLINPIILCGLMFGLKVFRHRLFETSPFMLGPAHSPHPSGTVTNSFRAYSSFDNGATHISMAGHNFRRTDAVIALGGDCDWMTRDELAEAIPPAFTEYIGRRLMEILYAADHRSP
jgi:DNA (cytosine-5)-methyltransferase 1